MTLWVFGDSFSAPEDNKNTYSVWYNNLAKHLNEEILNLSIFGASNQYIIKTWNEQYKHIKKDDYVVIVITSNRKTFFFKEKPQLSMLWMIDKQSYNKEWLSMSTAQQDAFTNYYQYLHDNDDVSLQVKSFLYWVNQVASKLNKKIIIIKSFNEFEIDNSEYEHLIISTEYSLIDISKMEVSEDEWRKMLINTDCYDTRSNHLSEHTHKNLTNSIIECLTTHELKLEEKVWQEKEVECAR